MKTQGEQRKLFKTSILKSILYDYSDKYILVSGFIAITGPDNATEANKRREEKLKSNI